MDKNAIKKYAVWARRELIDRVAKRAAVYGITVKSAGEYNIDSVNGHLLSGTEKRQRQALIRRIEEKGYEQVMEEVAYTWFNRFAALRFMEVNGYLPSHIRVFTDDEGRFKPQILSEAIHLELDGLNMEKVYQLKDANQDEELFKYLLIVQCNALNSILPGMFQKIEDYTELLLPDYLLREGSVIEQMVSLIPEDDWKDQVQIIGWLYQYYNTEPKDKVFADLKRNVKISKESIPAATQLFTPDWIVHYMVENSLGRLWLEGHPSARDKYLPAYNEDESVRVEEDKWNYYLEEAEQEPAIQAQLAEIRKKYVALKPEEILAIDPCAGSGHILCVLFDVLVQIYEDYGYTAREAAVSIVQNNLWGLDIDDRAAQLAYFAVMMKARQYDRRFFSKAVQPHVYAIQESNSINRDHLNHLGRSLSDIERNNAITQINALLDEFIDAKEYGSILRPREYDWPLLSYFVEDTIPAQQISLYEVGLDATQTKLKLIILQGQAMTQSYHAVVTNPPYMGANGMGAKLSRYVKEYYVNSKSDLSTVCMERCLQMCNELGIMAMINIPVWMFLSSYETLRTIILQHHTINNMIHIGRGIFGSDFGTTTFTIRALSFPTYRGCYSCLFKKQVEVASIDERERQFLSGKNRYYAQQNQFLNVPGAPIVYSMSEALIDCFKHEKVSDVAFPASGTSTGNNELYLRLWHEVDKTKINFNGCNGKINPLKWFPCNKGGAYRRWAGGNETLIDWENDGKRIKECPSAFLRNVSSVFLPGITWSKLGSGSISFRFFPEGYICESIGCCLFEKKVDLRLLLALMNSVITSKILSLINPTMGRQPGYVGAIPYIMKEENKEEIISCVEDNIFLSRADWDSYETSWDFDVHPLVRLAINHDNTYIANCWQEWKRECDERFVRMKTNEERINELFIDMYGLQNELTPYVEDKDVSVRKADLNQDVRSLISYAVGCMLGRYSIDHPGLLFAGGVWNTVNHNSYQPDYDGILPITDDEYFYDDIVTMFVNWIKLVFGSTTLEDNLIFIASVLEGKGSPREIIRNYFLNDFYKDHLKTYQKRPIYWMFDSGKKNGFKALIYMHRYQADTIARVRTDYVHEMQSRYRTAIADVEQRMNSVSTSERVKLTKRLTALQAQAEELQNYEEKVHHLADQMISIDLDNGVKKNYEIFKDVLAPIK